MKLILQMLIENACDSFDIKGPLIIRFEERHLTFRFYRSAENVNSYLLQSFSVKAGCLIVQQATDSV